MPGYLGSGRKEEFMSSSVVDVAADSVFVVFDDRLASQLPAEAASDSSSSFSDDVAAAAATREELG